MRSAATCRSPGPSSRRLAVTTFAPSAWSSRAASAPIPSLAPVTTQIFPPSPSSTGGYVTGPMTTIYLSRHGQTDWNAQRRWQGHADPPLNEAGRRESLALGEALEARGISRVYSSDLARARETAKIVGRVLAVEVELDARLREVDVGE